MLDALRLATILSLVLGAIIVVAHDQPLIRLVRPKYETLGVDVRFVVCATLRVAMLGGWLNSHTAGGAAVLTVSWAGALAYLWYTLITDLTMQCAW